MNAVIREAAEQNADFIDQRRGVIPDAQVLDLADALGMDAATLNRRKIGQAFNAEEVVAARKLLVQSASAVRDAMAKAATGTDADVMAYWVNGLISGPATHTTYAVGNALLAVWRAVPEAAAQAAIGAVRHAVTGSEDRAYMGEVGAGVYGIMKGLREGVVAAGEAIKSGQTTRLPGEPVADFALQQGAGAIPGPLGEVVRLPSRGVATIHSFFRALGYSQEKARLAYRQATREGLTGDAFAQRIAELSTNPTPEIMTAARDAATEQTLMGQGGEFSRALTQLAHAKMLGFHPLKWVMPFIKIGSNIMSQGLLERTPLGFLDPEVRANVLGRNGPVARDAQLARMTVGTAVAAATVGLAAQGYVTGGGPSDPKEAAMWRMTGKQPYSVRIGDTWYGVHRLGPLATVLGIGADMYEMGHALSTEESDKIGGMLVGTITKGLLDETWMRGPAQLIQALEDPDRYGARWLRDELSSFVPFSVGMSQVARAVDPYSRQARTMLDAVRNKVPWMSESLLPRYDIWGQPVPNKGALGVAGLSAIYETQVNNDPVNRTMLRLHVFPSAPERKVRGVTLTDQQYDDFARTAGRMAKMRLDVMVNSPGFSALPDGVQAQTIRQTITAARETARALLMMRNPQIIQQAIEAKKALTQPAR